jgi:hypothetical protein
MINLAANTQFTEACDFSGRFIFPAGFGDQASGPNPLSRLSREQLAAFLDAESNNARSAHFSVPRTEPPPPAAEKGLALGVLKQAAYDLRRFRDSTKGADRELYLDAHSWIMGNDFSWPYSFLNVCDLLHLCPEVVRAELLADAALGSFHYWIRRVSRLSRRLQASVVRAFAPSRGSEDGQLAPCI